MSPLRHRSVFWCKKRSKRPTPKSSFFRVRRQLCCLSLQIRSFSVEIGLTHLPCSARKSRQIPSRRACHRSPPLCHRSLLGRKMRKSGPVPEFRTRRVFRGPTASRGPGSERGSPPRFWLVTRQPAELVTAFVTAPSGSVFSAKSAQNGQVRKVRFLRQTASGMPEPQVSLVFGRKQALTLLRIPLSARKTGEFHPAKLVTACHRFVTALFWAEKCAKAAKFPRGLRSWQV